MGCLLACFHLLLSLAFGRNLSFFGRREKGAVWYVHVWFGLVCVGACFLLGVVFQGAGFGYRHRDVSIGVSCLVVGVCGWLLVMVWGFGWDRGTLDWVGWAGCLRIIGRSVGVVFHMDRGGGLAMFFSLSVGARCCLLRGGGWSIVFEALLCPEHLFV